MEGAVCWWLWLIRCGVRRRALSAANRIGHETRPRLAIVGGGQSAKAVLFSLAERLAGGATGWSGTEVVVLERSNEFGTGLAWSRRFALEAHQSSLAKPNSRVAYGDGQIRQFLGSIDVLASFGVRVVLRPSAPAVGISARDGSYRIVLGSGAELPANAVILATGYGSLEPSNGRRHPWPAQGLQALARDNTGAHWLVLGAYLTAVDAVLSLALASGSFEPADDGRLLFRARRPLRITVASRTGSLPAVWGAAPRPIADGGAIADELDGLRARNDGFIPLVNLLAMIERGLAERGGTRFLAARSIPTLPRYILRARALSRARARDARATLRGDLDRVRGVAGPLAYESLRHSALQEVLFAALPVVSECFHELWAEDHLAFQHEFRTLFFQHCMPMGLASAVQLLALMDAGVLDVLGTGRSYRLERSRERWQLEFSEGKALRWASFDEVVEARGTPIDLRAPADRLWQTLVERSMVRQARIPFRGRVETLDVGGVDVDPKSCRVRAPQAGCALYAMGPLVFGLFLDAQAIGHLSRDAARILDDLERARWADHSEERAFDGSGDSQAIQ
jgi:uncharacterized NAD(P)/FAD-binding protein YdhS